MNVTITYSVHLVSIFLSTTTLDETISYEDNELDSEDSDATFVYDVSSDNESDNNIF